MKLIGGKISQKGETNFLYVVLGVFLAIGAIVAVKYYQDREHNITIHVPTVEAH